MLNRFCFILLAAAVTGCSSEKPAPLPQQSKYETRADVRNQAVASSERDYKAQQKARDDFWRGVVDKLNADDTAAK